jgi:hypothetical protein
MRIDFVFKGVGVFKGDGGFVLAKYLLHMENILFGGYEKVGERSRLLNQE